MDRAALDDLLYRCLREIAVLADDGDRAALREVGLTPSQVSLLHWLDGTPAGHTVTRLAELTLCTRGNATRLVQRLTEAGLVEVGPDRGDARLVRVTLTAAGADRLAAARAAYAALNRVRLAGIADADAADLVDRLTGLSAQLRAHLEEARCSILAP